LATAGKHTQHNAAMTLLHRLRQGRHWLMLLLALVVVGLLPWTAYLSTSLPGEHVTHHWDLAWAGFDLFEAALLAATLLALIRRWPWLPVIAAAAGSALLCDMWFDVITAEPGRELFWAVVEAVVAEAPLAALCFWLAAESATERFSGGGASAAGPRPTSPPGQPAAARADARTPRSESPSAGRTSR
jgi:hypothetical protein